MSFQSTVALNQGFGVVGEVVFEGPLRAKPAILKVGSGGAAATDLVVGRYFSRDASDGQYFPGGAIGNGSGGILCNPKALASVGTAAGGPLAPTLVVPAGTVGELMEMGELVVALANACTPGDLVQFKLTDGTLKAQPRQASVTASIAVTTGIMTVTAVAAGSAPLAVGQTITGTGVPGGTIITALGTGTGGVGTYQTNIITAVASTTITADSVPDSGYAFIPGATIVRQANTAAGLAVVSLTGQQ